MTKLSTLRVGDGPRGTVLLHGYLGSGRNLWTIARAWSAADPSRTILLTDLTGHGSSPPLPPGADLSTMARDVLDTVRENGLAAPVTVVGHSLGGRVALAAFDVDASMLDEVVLLDIGPGPVGAAGLEHSRTAEAFARVPVRFTLREEARTALDGQGLPKPVVDWLLTNLVPADRGFTWRVDRQALLDLRPALNRSDLWGVVERHASSIRCIRGAESDYVSDDDAKRMEVLGCRVITLPGAGHFVHVDRPKELLQALLSVVAR